MSFDCISYVSSIVNRISRITLSQNKSSDGSSTPKMKRGFGVGQCAITSATPSEIHTALAANSLTPISIQAYSDLACTTVTGSPTIESISTDEKCNSSSGRTGGSGKNSIGTDEPLSALMR